MSETKYKDAVAQHLAQIKETNGTLDYHQIGQYLDFNEDYYLDLNKAFDPDIVEKYNLQCATDLRIGDKPPNCTMYGPVNDVDIINNDEKDNIKIELSSIISTTKQLNRFLVLNFGSYTWQPFVKIDGITFETIAKKHEDIAKFITIYIAEAHAIDEWNIYKDIEPIKQHKSINDRLDAAKCFMDKTKTKVDVYLDDMDNNSLKKYSSSPDRLYIIDVYKNQIVFIGDMGPTGYKPEKVDEFLKNYKAKCMENKLYKSIIFTGFGLLASYCLYRNVNY